MLETTNAIVFRTLNYSETSVICKIYTESRGLLSFIVNGVRSAKAKNKAALLKPGNQLEIVYYFRENKNLLRMKEYRFKKIYQSIPFNAAKTTTTFFFIELLNRCVREEQQNPELFEFVIEQLLKLDDANEVALLPFEFVFGLTAHLGFMPEKTENELHAYFDLETGNFCKEIPNHRFFIDRTLSKHLNDLLLDFSENRSMRLVSKPTQRDLMRDLMRFYAMHVENFIMPKALRMMEFVLYT